MKCSRPHFHKHWFTLTLVLLLIISAALLLVFTAGWTPGILGDDGKLEESRQTYQAREIYEEDKITIFRQFQTQLTEFYDFSHEFFAVWDYHIEDTEGLFEKFNNSQTPIEQRIIYAGMLRQKYEKFGNALMQITPPPEASQAHQYALAAISKRIEFFAGFEQGKDMSVLMEIKDDSYFYEMLFWEEIDSIYDYFDQMAEDLKRTHRHKELKWI